MDLLKILQSQEVLLVKEVHIIVQPLARRICALIKILPVDLAIVVQRHSK